MICFGLLAPFAFVLSQLPLLLLFIVPLLLLKLVIALIP
jgi:hypothetical protein